MSASPTWTKAVKATGIVMTIAIFCVPFMFPGVSRRSFAFGLILLFTIAMCAIAFADPKSAAYFTRNPEKTLEAFDRNPNAMAIAMKVSYALVAILILCIVYFAR